MATAEVLLGLFDEHCARLRSVDVIDDVSGRAEVPPQWLEEHVGTAIAEARHTLTWLGADLRPGLSVLEVGAGLGITSGFLSLQGNDITSIEPGGEGFELYRRANPALRSAFGIDHPHYEIAIEECLDRNLGRFGLIFSNNVLEHVRDVKRTLLLLDEMLSAGGTMLHACPNYSVPFEPHFGLPLLPFRPAATARLLPRALTESGLWRSLNFVRARDIAAIAESAGRSVSFDAGVLADTVLRLSDDERFAGRHRMLARVARPLRATAPLLRYLPARAVTPMVFRWSKPS